VINTLNIQIEINRCKVGDITVGFKVVGVVISIVDRHDPSTSNYPRIVFIPIVFKLGIESMKRMEG